MPTVLELEQAYATPCWDEDTYVQNLKRRNCIAMLVESVQDSGDIQALFVYDLHKTYVHVLHLFALNLIAMDTLLRRIKAKLSVTRRSRLDIVVDELDLRHQCMLRDLGVRVRMVMRGDGIDGGDQYVFRIICED